MRGSPSSASTLILCDRVRTMRRLTQVVPGPVRVLRLHYSEETEAMRRELCSRPDARELSRQALCREYEEEFRVAFVALMAGLAEEHQGFDWTVMPFTSKNPLSSDFLQNVFYCIVIARVLARETQTLVVLTGNCALAAQLVAWGHEHGVRVVAAVAGTAAGRSRLKHALPVAIVAAFFGTLLLAALARSLRPPMRDGEPWLVVVTTMPQSAVGPEGYREAYFAPLVPALAASNSRALILALIFAQPVKTILRLRRTSTPLPVVPMEAWLTLADLAGCLVRSLRQWARMPRFDTPAVIGGVDVRPLLRSAVRETCRSAGFFRHLSVSRAARRLARSRRVSGWIYPFENRAMERALLLGVRDGDSRATLVGCQNAALTRSHLNFMLGPREATVVPLPDVLFTTGRPVRDLVVDEGNFPADRVRIGCALRQARNSDAAIPVKPAQLRRVLVVLASSVGEYVEMLMFVADAFRAGGAVEGNSDVQREVRVRPHPEFALASALRVTSLPADFAYHASTGSLADDLAWADVVLYASSTVSMEAVVRGIPVIHVDVGHALNADPLFGRTHGLRWAVQRPADVAPCLRAIEALSEPDYLQRFNTDRAYVDEYLVPADAQRIQTLVETARCPT